jgi:hypothetical protein
MTRVPERIPPDAPIYDKSTEILGVCGERPATQVPPRTLKVQENMPFSLWSRLRRLARRLRGAAAAAAKPRCDSCALWPEAIMTEPAGKVCEIDGAQIGFRVAPFGVG